MLVSEVDTCKNLTFPGLRSFNFNRFSSAEFKMHSTLYGLKEICENDVFKFGKKCKMRAENSSGTDIHR